MLPRIDDDLAAWLHAAAIGGLPEGGGPTVAADACVTVVMASAGYPVAPRTGMRWISGRGVGRRRRRATRVRVYHAGTALDGDGRLVTAGGRVLAVTAGVPTLEAARDAAYARRRPRSTFDGARSDPTSPSPSWCHEGRRADGLAQRRAEDGSRVSTSLAEFGVEVEEHVMSAHRTPEAVAEFAADARRGRLRRW